MLRAILLVFLVTFGYNSFSQDYVNLGSTQRLYFHSLQLGIENGTILGRGSNFLAQTANSSYYNGVDLRYGWAKLDQSDLYNRIYRNPTLGVGLSLTAVHLSKIGNPSALYFFFSLPVSSRNSSKWSLSYTGSFGLSYNFDAQEEQNNTKYDISGYYWKCYLSMACNLNFRVSQQWSSFASFGYKHFSNGSIWRPNQGINLFPATLGVKYQIDFQKRDENHSIPRPKFIGYNQWNIMLALASKNYVGGAPNYLKASLGVNYLRQLNFKYRLGIGLDLFYSGGYSERNPGKQPNFANTFSYALVGNWEWVINKIVYAPLSFGYYLHHNFENYEKANFFERIGLRFRLRGHYNLGISIKAHQGGADMLEWTLGYTFHKDPNTYHVK